MQVIFDTGSSWLWFPTKECGSDCHQKAQLFDTESSDSYFKVSRTPSFIQYGKGSVWGYKSRDVVCLEKNEGACLKDYNFLSIFTTADLSFMQSDGVLGLAPGKQNTDSELFLDRLVSTGLITTRMFSFSLGGENETSSV